MVKKHVFGLVVILLMLVVSACGGSDEPETTPASGSNTTATETAGSTSPSTPADSGTRTITHELGETEIEGTPERIVVLEWPYVEALLAMGVQPVGIADVAGYNRLINSTPALADDVTDLGTRQEPSLESIAALEPDLIIGVKFRHEAIYETLSDIAPTLIFDPYAADGEQLLRMEDTVMTIAEAINQPEAGEAALAKLHATMDEAAQTLEEAGFAGSPFVLSQTLGGEMAQLRLFHENATAVQILEGIGLENAWQADFEQIGFTTVGLEALTEVEDANFFFVPSDDTAPVSFEGNPVWDNLPFVTEGRTYNLSGAWLLAGPLSGQVFVERVVAALTGEDAGTTTETGPREIEHALGTTTIEGTPERVVVLEWTYAEDLLAVGVQPVGVADVAGYQSWVNVEPALSAEVTDVGTRQEPSLESIAALKPDLIIGVQFRHEAIYQDLSAIAPTLMFNPYPEDEEVTQLDEMEQTFSAIAEAVNRQADGEQVLTEMHASFEDAKAQIETAGQGGSEFVLAQAFSGASEPQMRLFVDNSMAAQILKLIGLQNAWEGEFDIYGFNTVGLESLTTVEDANFFYVVQENDNPFADQWANNPVWTGLAFVQDERTYSLDGDTWLFGGPLSAELVVDKFLELLAG